jgi:uncharacterized damage-inducible protein DinB
MTERDRLSALFDHLAWADASMWRSVCAVPAAEADERLIALLHHLHLVQWIYLGLWREEMPALTEAKAYRDAAAVLDWARPYHPQAAAFIGALTDNALDRVVTFPWADQIAQRFGGAAPATLRDTIAQVLFHTTYHRAQVATRVRDLGGEPALTDYIAWIWMHRPRAEWPGVQKRAG